MRDRLECGLARWGWPVRERQRELALASRRVKGYLPHWQIISVEELKGATGPGLLIYGLKGPDFKARGVFFLYEARIGLEVVDLASISSRLSRLRSWGPGVWVAIAGAPVGQGARGWHHANQEVELHLWEAG